MVTEDLWVVGGLERETRRTFTCLVRRRDHLTLFAIIQHFVKPGSAIITYLILYFILTCNRICINNNLSHIYLQIIINPIFSLTFVKVRRF
jgi:hypothetical protein